MTNEAKIKGMTTKELAEFISNSSAICESIENCASNCVECYDNWLKAEAAPAAESAVTK